MKIAIVGAGRRFNGCLLLIKEKDVEVLRIWSKVSGGKQIKAAAGLSTPGFPSVVIKPGVEWPVWEPIYQDLVSDLENDGYDTSFMISLAALKKDDSKLTVCISMQKLARRITHYWWTSL